jgi:hypothetical protein
MSEPVLFRKLEEPEPDEVPRFLTSAEFFGAHFLEVPAAAPENPLVARGEWYCQAERCPVRQVRIRCVQVRKALPVMHCPACGERMTFHHYFKTVTWVPVQAPAPEPTT